MTETTPGDRLRLRRRELRISAEELGRRAALVLGRGKPFSASAVRNQENGTNGIPMTVARAYAEILRVDPQWILFGDEDLSPNDEERRLAKEMESKAQSQRGSINFTDIGIATYGIISGRWLPEMVKVDNPEEYEDRLWIYVPGWSGSVPLVAYEVGDGSLEPVYPKGTWLICANETDSYIGDGHHVVANRWLGDYVMQCVREVRTTREGIDLVAVGMSGPPTEPLLRNGKLIGHTWVEEVVVASFNMSRWTGGPPLLLPDSDRREQLARTREKPSVGRFHQSQSDRYGSPNRIEGSDTTE